ncbi:MAG: HesA/MoeB/ThiF family protein [Promethearchaeota archaeon]|jgi:molybdopterin/thiamine biosynthesis adenylyltransferase
MDFSEEQIERYSRQIVLEEIGGVGQEKLLNSKVTIIGCGGLGSPVAYYLTAAGIGHIKLIDFDKVDLSNLHRQILHFTDDVNKEKTKSAYEKLHKLNPDVNIEIVKDILLPENIKEILEGSDFVIDGSDNIPTKMLINDACINLKIPFTIAGVVRFNGQIITVIPDKKTACYRCVFGDVTEHEPSMSCSQAGIIGLIPGIVGCIQANEAIKCILGIGDLIINRMLFLDLLKYRFSFIKIVRNEDCVACGDNAGNLVETLDYRIGDACFE